MVKIAVVGAGFIGEVHAKSLQKVENAEITAVVSSREKEGKEFADKYGARLYPDLDSVLEEGDIECVDLCTPTFTHEEMTIKSAEAGKHILCEKPLALSVKEIDRMIAAVKANGVKAMSGHTMRFWPEYVKGMEIIESGQLGKPLHAFGQRLAATPDWHKNNWDFNEKLGGGASIDLHIHDLDVLLWIFGRPVKVSAMGVYNPDLGGVAHITTNVEFSGGGVGFAEGGWIFKGAFPFTMVFRVLCEKGTVEWIFRAGKNIEERASRTNLIVYKADGTVEEPEVPDEDAYYRECKYFIDCVEQDKEIEIATFEQGREAVRLALAATQSAKQNKIIKIK